MLREAIQAQREVSDEVDREAARLIREHGMALWPAIEQAHKNVARSRRFRTYRTNLSSWFGEHS